MPHESSGALVRSAVVLVGLAVTLSVPFEPPAAASCAAPYLQVDGQEEARVAVLSAESTVVVDGLAFSLGCEVGGTVTTVGGCSSSDQDEPDDDARPMTDVELVVVQGDRRWELGTADAGTAADGEQGQITWTVDLPAGLRPGAARLRTVPEESIPTQTLAVRIVR